jgi:hypothetical protein
MREMHLRYPEYGFARHKGYSTPGHMKALTAHGPCPEHRRSFVNVGSVICGDPGQAIMETGPGDNPAEVDAEGLVGVGGDSLAGAGGDGPAGVDGDGVACGDPGQEN